MQPCTSSATQRASQDHTRGTVVAHQHSRGIHPSRSDPAHYRFAAGAPSSRARRLSDLPPLANASTLGCELHAACAFGGVAALVTADVLIDLRARGDLEGTREPRSTPHRRTRIWSPRVPTAPPRAAVFDDTIMRARGVATAPYHLDRVDARAGYDRAFEPGANGAGVVIYVVDSGLATEHS